MEIFRVEKRKKNEGPFQNEEMNIFIRVNYLDSPSNWPTALEDGIVKVPHFWCCGCPDLKTLKHWFGCVAAWLKINDYVIKVFKTEDYIISKSKLQVFFDRKYQRVRKVLPMTALLDS